MGTPANMRVLLLIVILLVCQVATAQGAVETLTFEDAPVANGSPLTDGYGQLRWRGVSIRHGVTTPQFARGIVSGARVGVGYSMEVYSGHPFTARSIWATSVNSETTQIEAVAWFGTSRLYTNTFYARGTPTLLQLDYPNITRLQLVGAATFIVDDFVVDTPDRNLTLPDWMVQGQTHFSGDGALTQIKRHRRGFAERG